MSKRILVLAALLACAGLARAEPTPRQQLGDKLFHDENLSTPAGQACSSCHHEDAAFSDPERRHPASEGVVSGRFGNRNAPTAMYAAYVPPLRFDKKNKVWLGGLFHDGRAASLEAQAGGPLLNPLEMANPDKAAVIAKVRSADYAPLFREVFGKDALDDTERAFGYVTQAIAAFERTAEFAPFSSKYDAWLAGRVKLSPQEKHGLALFEDARKGNCAACHPSRPGKDGKPPLFTDFTYDNLGVPQRPDHPFLTQPAPFNPAGASYVDRGLGAQLNKRSEDGKFRVPTLRNVARTVPYMHNGYFETLRGAVEFYNSRDVLARCATPLREADAAARHCWPKAEVARNVNRKEMGKLKLSARDVDDIVAFLNTLTDGYRESAKPRAGAR